MEERLTFGTALKIIFEYIQSPPSVLAEQYVDRDRTLVYKWLRDTAFPPKKLFPDIIRFVTECSGDSIRDLIRMEMDRRLSESELGAQHRKMLDEKLDFADYLESIFSMLAAEKARDKALKQAETPDCPETCPRLESPSPTEAETSRQLPIPAPARQEIHIRLPVPIIKNIGFAILAALSGELLWSVAAYAFQWTHAVSGFPVFLRGFLVFPIIVFAMLSLKEGSPVQVLPKTMKLVYVGCYGLAGGAGALLLAESELERLLKGFLPGYLPQTLLLIFIQALVLSFFPLLILLALLRFPRAHPCDFLLLEFGPALVCVLATLPVLLPARAPSEILWLGGFVPCCVLKLLMFLSTQTVFRGYPDTIK